MDPNRRDREARAVADGLARHLTELVDGLMETLTAQLPAADRWSDSQYEAVRGGVRQLALGFVRWLRIGDLEANHAERLRQLVATPIPGTRTGESSDLTRTVRMDATDLLARGLDLDEKMRRYVDRELEAYLNLLQPRELRLTDEDGEIDAWLARIATGSKDVT